MRPGSGSRARTAGTEAGRYAILFGARLLSGALVALLCGCASSAPVSISAGQSRKQVLAEKVGAFRRSYRLHVPAGYDPADATPRPLVVALHGAVARGAIFERQSGFSELADDQGFFVVYPNGIGLFGLFRHWNGGWCCARALRRGVDDVGFVDRVVEHVAARYPVEPDRLIVVGYSNGGMLAYLYAASRSERVAGLGVFASSPGLVDADGEPIWLPPVQENPVPAFLAHGSADPRLPVAGSPPDAQGRRTLGAEEAAKLWAERNGCETGIVPGQVTVLEKVGVPEGLSSRMWCVNQARVWLEILTGRGHEWPRFDPTFTGWQDARNSPSLERYDAARGMWHTLGSWWVDRSGRDPSRPIAAR